MMRKCKPIRSALGRQEHEFEASLDKTVSHKTKLNTKSNMVPYTCNLTAPRRWKQGGSIINFFFKISFNYKV